jgi:4-hydroxy-tetrahydrodipicolinate synthase
MTDLHGVFPYLVSPIDPSGKIRTEVLGRLCDDLIKAGVHGLTPLGSTGEFAISTEPARGGGADHDRGGEGVPVIAGVASTSTTDLRAGQGLRARGRRHPLWRRICPTPVNPGSALLPSRHPVVIYTAIQRSISLDVIERLAAHPASATSGCLTNTGRVVDLGRCGDAIRVFSASAHIPAAVMLIGGVGWMAGPACIIPRQSVELYNLCKAKRWDEPMALQRKLWRINEAFARFNLAACIKAGLEIQGYAVGDPVPPQAALTADQRRIVEAALRDVD